MLNRKISELLNDQINAELHSAYLYLAYAGYFDRLGLDGFANWYKVQSLEEIDHAMKFYNYLIEQGEYVRLDAISKAYSEETEILDVLRKAKVHEQLITERINRLYTEAAALNDLRTVSFLGWFINEQAEEEKNAEEMVQKFLLYGSCDSYCSCSSGDGTPDYGQCGGGLYALNKEYAGRTHCAKAWTFE